MPSRDRTGSRFKAIAHSFLTFPRVNYTEHGSGGTQLRSPVHPRPFPFSWRGRDPAGASLPRAHFPALSKQSQPGSGREPRAQPAMRNPVKVGVNGNLGCRTLPGSGDTPAPNPELGLAPLVTKPQSRGRAHVASSSHPGSFTSPKENCWQIGNSCSAGDCKAPSTIPLLLGRERRGGFVCSNISGHSPIAAAPAQTVGAMLAASISRGVLKMP